MPRQSSTAHTPTVGDPTPTVGDPTNDRRLESATVETVMPGDSLAGQEESTTTGGSHDRVCLTESSKDLVPNTGIGIGIRPNVEASNGMGGEARGTRPDLSSTSVDGREPIRSAATSPSPAVPHTVGGGAEVSSDETDTFATPESIPTPPGSRSEPTGDEGASLSEQLSKSLEHELKSEATPTTREATPTSLEATPPECDSTSMTPEMSTKATPTTQEATPTTHERDTGSKVTQGKAGGKGEGVSENSQYSVSPTYAQFIAVSRRKAEELKAKSECGRATVTVSLSILASYPFSSIEGGSSLLTGFFSLYRIS